MQITPEAVMEVVTAETGISAERLRPEATLAELDISSLDVASIVFELEDRFGIEMEVEGLTADLTLAQLVDRIRDRAGDRIASRAPE